MQLIPTWKLGNKLIKLGYLLQAILRCYLLCTFNKELEIFHIHGAANASFYRCKIFIHIAKLFKKKVILHEHAADFIEFYKKSNKKNDIVETINKCDVIIVLSESWKTFFSSIGVDSKKIHIVNNIIPSPTTQKRNKKDNKLHLLFMGEISIRKGCFDLLQAISENDKHLRDKILLRIAGNAVDGNIQTFIENHKLENFVIYEGWISGEKKIECLNWADIYILPSYNEGLPIAILESMSYKKPIISTPVGGIPEIVKNNNNGILISPGNKQEIFEAIKYYIENPIMIRKHGEESYKIVQDYFPEKVFAQLIEIYSLLLK